MDITKRYMLERVLGILDPEMVSDERIEAFRNAAMLYHDWSSELERLKRDGGNRE